MPAPLTWMSVPLAGAVVIAVARVQRVRLPVGPIAVAAVGRETGLVAINHVGAVALCPESRVLVAVVAIIESHPLHAVVIAVEQRVAVVGALRHARCFRPAGVAVIREALAFEVVEGTTRIGDVVSAAILAIPRAAFAVIVAVGCVRPAFV